MKLPSKAKKIFKSMMASSLFVVSVNLCGILTWYLFIVLRRAPGLYRIRGPGVDEIYHANFFWAREAAVVP